MSEKFWHQMPGGRRHFLIVLLLASVVFGLAAWRSREGGLRRGLHATAPVFAPSRPQPDASGQLIVARAGEKLFLKNCAHCHGADGTGDEGPDLHNLDWTDDQIAMRIRDGKKGQMTAFAGKLTPEDIASLIAYLRTFK